MSATTSARPTPATTPLYDGYATIRGRGLTRSLSIRAKEVEAAASAVDNSTTVITTDAFSLLDHNKADVITIRPIKITERKRTVSLRQDSNQSANPCNKNFSSIPNSMTQSLYEPILNNLTKTASTSTTTPIQQCQNEDIYIDQATIKNHNKTSSLTNELETLYASTNASFRPLSETSSSSGCTTSVNGYRDSVIDSTGSDCINMDYNTHNHHHHNGLKKNSRFSLDSLHSSNAPKTPDYHITTDGDDDEDQIFLYTAPESPKRRLDSGIRSSYDESSLDHSYSPLNRNLYDMIDGTISNCTVGCSVTETNAWRTPSEHSHSSNSPRKLKQPVTNSKECNSVNEKRTRPSTLIPVSISLLQPSSLSLSSAQFRNNKNNNSLIDSPTYGKPPPTPIRRESLYTKPKICNNYYNTTAESINYRNCGRPALTPINCKTLFNSYQLVLPSATTTTTAVRSSSAEILDRSHTSHSLATIDQDNELMIAVPSAMPVLQNPIDRRYHTLGHMRVQSLGNSLHRTPDSPLGSMLNIMTRSYYDHRKLYNSSNNNSYNQYYHHQQHFNVNKSMNNIMYASAEAAIEDLNQLASEYMDPLDFKIGCQTTLRSKPIIPWYELAIRKDMKRQSCPPITTITTNRDNCNNSAVTSTPQAIINQQQITDKAHVVAAFEQSLSNMTTRLQQLTATAERKDGELTDMRQTIELLRKQSIQAGLTTAHMQSMGVQTQSQSQNDLLSNKLPPLPTSSRSQLQQHVTTGNGHANTLQRHHSSDSMCSVNSISSGCSTQDKKKKKGWLRSSFTKAFSRNAKISKTSRGVQQHHHSLNGPNTLSNNTNQGSDTNHSINGTPIINRNNHHNNNNQHHDIHQTHHQHGEPPGLAALATQPTILCSPTKLNINNSNSNTKSVTLIDNAKPIDAIDHEDNNNQQIVEDLKKQLREKDLVLTDIRLEALSSASQLESLKETVNKMRAEMMSLKQNNERLQKLVTSRSLAGSEASLGNAISPNSPIGSEASRRYSLADGNTRPPMELPKRLDEEVEEENVPPAPAPEPPPTLPLSPSTHIDLTPPPPALEPLTNSAHLNAATHDIPDINDGKKIAIAVYLGQPESFQKYCEELMEADEYFTNGTLLNNVMIENSIERKTFSMPGPNEFIIAYTYISGKTTWQNLDYIVRKTFKDYVSRIDPGTNLGLNTDSITSYHLGEAKRGPEMGFPELLPCGYIIGNVKTLYICLQGVGSLAFDSLIPRSIVHRYISLLTEHRRLILCGPSGTGKSYLARRLAEFLVARIGNKSNSPSEAIATFNVDHKSSKELRQYLSHIAEQAAIANRESELPSVIILDNLHHASALGDVFSCLLSAGPAAKLPCIIGTMSQATCNTTNLQLHHNFRWVLTANHMEPVKGFLGRFLRRRLFQLELQAQHTQPELATVLAWLPTVWQHINRFLEAHSSSDVTIGPRLFLSCPLDLKESQVWFTDIWNYHLSPYLIEAVREGVQLYGRRGGAWNDPSAFIRNSYPWPYGPDSVPPLRQINAEDVGLEGVPSNNSENQDPLLNMLMRLQEAANYSENPDPESDCASLDSNVTPDSSAGAE